MEGQKRSLDLSAIGAREEEGGEVGEVHWLPCAIEHDGEAKIDAYFRSSMTSRSASSQGEPEGETKEAYLRGRHLKGAELPLPKGYCAVLLEKEVKGAQIQCPGWNQRPCWWRTTGQGKECPCLRLHRLQS